MNSGRIIERRDQVLTGFLSLVAMAFSPLATRWWSTKGPFLRERVICYPLLLAARHDHGLCALVVAGAITLGQIAPRIDSMTAFASAAFATTVRVIDRVHGHATHRRADTHPALDTGLAELAQAVLFVGHFANRCTAFDVDVAHFTRAHTHRDVAAIAGQQRRRSTCRASDLRTCTGLELDAVDGRAHGDVADRQRVAHADRGFGAAHNSGAHFEVARSNHVATLTVGVAHQSDVGRAVGVVLDVLNLGGNTVLVALEVHHAVVVLVTTALVTGGDVTVVVAASLLVLGLQQRGVTRTLIQVIARDLHHGTLAGRGGFHFDDSHDYAASPLRFSS